ncbi:hydrogenase expression/formation protein HypE [Pyrofollis japonicus]|uniref:hydrogenase expression/formation protein HypE n=1 Tax=Pyrofollis japonicus TaxID=3060460 RepID=UPI00295B63BF|nr:hydrogenase expression/formation protein HypE [Pyrofollis japonicus]BEP18448.1 hydrogenase expression/formation protein HypE [Pyrofollis japonicus]
MTWYVRLWKLITLAHGSGGKETEDLIKNLIVNAVPPEYWRVDNGAGLDALDDAALIPLDGGKYIALTIDSYTVKPIFFPGGDIGVLAASGTINDLLMVGAKPVAALDAVIVEEGFETEKLKKIIDSYVSTLVSNSVALIGGDFKVMPKGQVDGVVIASAGIGIVEGKPIDDREIKPGDKLIVTGYVGDHGAAILAAQQTIGVEFDVKSDVKPLTSLMLPLLEKYRNYIHGAGDPTRGGIAMLANDWAEKTRTVIVIEEEKVPIRPQVKEYAEMLGVDPLSLANEGAAVLAVDGSKAEEILDFIHGLGYKEAAIIGQVYEPKDPHHAGRVLLKSVTGGVRILEPPSGEIVPRIC